MGARVPRKEDARHLHGKGNFVADMAMPGLSEVAFLRSPLAHARIASVRVASQIADKAFVRQAMADARDIVADSTLPSYQVSAQPPLASGRCGSWANPSPWWSRRPAPRPRTTPN